MLRPGRLLPLLLLAAALFAVGAGWWSTQQRFPVTRPAAELVLRQADLPDSFVPLEEESGAILTNPYGDYTEHFRSGHRAVFKGRDGTRLVSSTFVVDQKGAHSVFNAYVGQTRQRGQVLALPTLGEQSLFLVARDEPSAPLVVIGAVQVKNVLITLTLMTDQELDPTLVYRWAEVLVGRTVLSITAHQEGL